MESACGHFEAVIDGQGNIVAIGPRLAFLAGCAPSEIATLIGRPIQQLVRGPALTGPLGQTLALEVRGGDRPPTQGLALRSVDGAHLRLTFLPEVAGGRGAAGQRGADVTTRELIAEIHDGLAAIAGFASMTQLAPTPHRRRYHADHIVSQVERLRRLAQAFDPGYFARAPLMAPADLAVELPRALAGLRIPLERYGVAFEVQCGDGALWAACDARLLGDIVTQLIVRATLAQRREFQANEVEVTVLPTAGERIAVTIRLSEPDEVQLLLNDRFGLGDDAGGTTLPPGEIALRWAHLALERQGGTFERRVDQVADEVTLTLTVAKHPSPRTLDQMRTPVPLDILVIDDDAILGELYVELLAISGHSVTPCRTLKAAREALADHRFDVVVAEFQLRDGLVSELWAEAREAHPVLADRLLVVTRDPRDKRLIEWSAASGVSLVAKPVPPPFLIDRIAQLASQS